MTKDDPTFRMHTDTETGQLIISGMGELHLEVITTRLERDWGVIPKVGRPRVSYKQTIKQAAAGEHHFSRQAANRTQSAHVKLRLEASDAPDKVEVEVSPPENEIPRRYHQRILESVQTAASAGIEWGYPLINARVVVTGGSHDPAEATPEAFAAASSLAFRDAAAKAGASLLEPIMRLEIHVPDDYYGNVVNDLNGRRATIEDLTMLKDSIRVIRGQVPLSEMFGYSTTLRSITQGRGSYSMEPHSYVEVPDHLAPKPL